MNGWVHRPRRHVVFLYFGRIPAETWNRACEPCSLVIPNPNLMQLSNEIQVDFIIRDCCDNIVEKF